MDITGKITQILAAQTGEGKNGSWKKQSFVIETLEDYPKNVCFTTWNDRVELDKMVIGEQVKVYFDVESREYNGRWYTDLKAWKSETIGGANGRSVVIPQNEIIETTETDPLTDDGDLPF